MSASRQREKWLLNLMPAALVLALYAFLFAVPAQRANNDLMAQLKRTKVSSIDEAVAEQSRENLKLAQSGLTRLAAQVSADREQIVFLGKQWSSGEARLSTVQQVTELLEQFSLSIVSQDFQEEPPFSAYLNSLEEIIQQHSGDGQALNYWQIEIAGSYPAMMNFLSQVKSSGLRTFPVTLAMKASDASDGIHTWTVVFVV